MAFGSSGKLCIGKFPCYDSNVTIEICATTSITYHATIILATQNINTTGGVLYVLDTYGDETDAITPNIYMYYPSNSRYIELYFSPSEWSKNFIHIKCLGMQATPTNICESISSIPTTATVKPTNRFTSGSVTYASRSSCLISSSKPSSAQLWANIGTRV